MGIDIDASGPGQSEADASAQIAGFSISHGHLGYAQRYRVKVYERPYEYDIEANDPSAAEAHVIAANWAGSYEDIARVEVARRCQCGAENDLSEP